MAGFYRLFWPGEGREEEGVVEEFEEEVEDRDAQSGLSHSILLDVEL